MPRFDYFNDGEASAQRAFALRRDRLFYPIVRLLTRVGIKPLHISIFGVVLCSTVLFLSPEYWPISALMLGLYVLADGIDGPLARATTGGSKGGALIDIFSDQVGVFIVALAAVTWLNVSSQAHFVFAFFYVLCVFAMVAVNVIGEKLIKTARVKYIYFLLYLISCATRYDFLIEWFAIAFSVYYSIMFFVHFYFIIKGVDGD